MAVTREVAMREHEEFRLKEAAKLGIERSPSGKWAHAVTGLVWPEKTEVFEMKHDLDARARLEADHKKRMEAQITTQPRHAIYHLEDGSFSCPDTGQTWPKGTPIKDMLIKEPETKRPINAGFADFLADALAKEPKPTPGKIEEWPDGARISALPSDCKARKAIPIARGVLDYFPAALAAVAEVSRIGNEQHNAGQPLHWSRGLSTDHDDSAIRHFMERGTMDADGGRHSAKAVWRMLARLQMEIEAESACMSYDAYIAKVQKEESEPMPLIK
jgi:Domain of unknown function (DUF5664)